VPHAIDVIGGDRRITCEEMHPPRIRVLSSSAAARRIKSLSVAMPTSLPALSTTGTALMRFSSKIFATSRTVALFLAVITGETIARLHDQDSLVAQTGFERSARFRFDLHQIPGLIRE
jgi:hypothetical protein